MTYDHAFIVVPALNEAPRITSVLEAANNADPRLIQENMIVVVDNLSDDATRHIAEAFTEHVLVCPERGKGYAMRHGVEYAKQFGARVITFLDADLIGLKPDHINDLTRPVLYGETPMSIGIMGGRRWLGKTSVVGAFSGQRSVTTALWDTLRPTDLIGWRTEGALNAALRNARPAVTPRFIYLDGVGQSTKFAKERPKLKAGIDYIKMAGSAGKGLLSKANT